MKCDLRMRSVYVVSYLVTLLSCLNANAFDLFGPSIECTVVKVKNPIAAFGFKKFPKLYSSIYNSPNEDILKISDKPFKGVKPISSFKTETFEKIQIDIGKETLTLELSGKPLSRNGVLRVNGKDVAEVTCH